MCWASLRCLVGLDELERIMRANLLPWHRGPVLPLTCSMQRNFTVIYQIIISLVPLILIMAKIETFKFKENLYNLPLQPSFFLIISWYRFFQIYGNLFLRFYISTEIFPFQILIVCDIFHYISSHFLCWQACRRKRDNSFSLSHLNILRSDPYKCFIRFVWIWEVSH